MTLTQGPRRRQVWGQREIMKAVQDTEIVNKWTLISDAQERTELGINI